jgi:hypothetical protein
LTGDTTMNPITAGVAGALISGVAMYTMGTKATAVDAFSQNPAFVQTVDGQYVRASYATSLRPAAGTSAPAVTPVTDVRRAPATRTAARSTASRSTVSDQREIVRDEEIRPERSWAKTAMVVGGSAASGAGVGGIVGGKKGALIGAAIGGGAASIYESTRRR